jgi:hypothetical protein
VRCLNRATGLHMHGASRYFRSKTRTPKSVQGMSITRQLTDDV